MLYEVLAALWHGPADDLEVARSIEDRTGERFSRDAAARFLRTLHDGGFIDTVGDRFQPSYAINTEGSLLLARLARTLDPGEALSA